VFFNGKKVGSVKTGESKAIALPDIDGILQVGITKADGGLNCRTTAAIKTFRGAPFPVPDTESAPPTQASGLKRDEHVVVLDVISLCYIPISDAECSTSVESPPMAATETVWRTAPCRRGR
jgi:hypothetical protein